ncbi:MAG: hypothetical protein ACOWWO_12115 [Peptococcaceae bacterium]
MADITARLELKKPLGNETFNRESYNENLDLIDQNAETTDGAQAKALAAENAARAYTDQEVGAVSDEVSAHTGDSTNPHMVTKLQVGLGNVDNVQQAPLTHVGAAGSAHGTATTSAAGFMSAADKSKLNGIEAGATGNQTAAEILTALKTVDGSGSGLDADTLDGQQASAFEPAFSKNNAFNKNFGTASGTVCQGNDTRLSNARTPTAHNHSAGNINSGTLAIARIPTGTSSSTVCVGNDSRLSNSRQCNNNFDNAATARSNLEVRRITSGTADPSGGSNGDIYFQR